MEYGLIGYPLGHSYSKVIHDDLNFYNYQILPLSEEQFRKFMTERNFLGINVTIPYKVDVIEYLDELDESVTLCGSCNTVVNENGKLKGYNTDFKGFIYALQIAKIEVNNKVVGVLGDGGTSKTVQAALKHLGAKQVLFTSRKASKGSVSIDEIFDVEVLINTTSVGMAPNYEECLVDIDKFSKLEAVFDVIYNPLKTKLVLSALAHNIKASNGLLMLVAQAFYACQIFTKQQLDEKLIRALYFHLYLQKINIVFIGMPMSGKSSVGRYLSPLLNKEFVDTDELIEAKQHLKVKEIFSIKGEGHFRMVEASVVKSLACKNDLVISTGGGAPLNPLSAFYLKHNGLIIYLTRDTETLRFGPSRPTASNLNDYLALKKVREPIYLKHKDLEFVNIGSIRKMALNIKEAIYESIDNQWS